MDISVEQMTDNTSKREQNSVVPAGCFKEDSLYRYLSSYVV